MGISDAVSAMTLKVNYDGKAAEKGLSDLTKIIVGAISIAAIKQTTEYAIGLAKIGAQAVVTERNFVKMTESLGGNSKKMISELKSVTLGMVDDTDLMAMSYQAMLRKINFKDVKVAMEYATKYALSTGENFNDVYEQIMLSFARNTSRGLAQLGINIGDSKNVVVDAVKVMQGKMGDFSVSMDDPLLKQKQMEVSIGQMRENIGKQLIPAYSKWLTFLNNDAVPVLDAIINKMDMVLNPRGKAKEDIKREEVDRLTNQYIVLNNALKAAEEAKLTSYAVVDENGNMAMRTIKGAKEELKILQADIDKARKDIGMSPLFNKIDKPKKDRTSDFAPPVDEQKIKEENEKRLKLEEDYFASLELLYWTSSLEGIKTEQASREELKKLDEQYNQETIDNDKSFYEEHLGFVESAGGIENQIKSEDYISDKENYENIEKEKTRIAQEEAQKRLDISREWVSTISTLTNGLQTLSEAQTAKKIRDLDKLHLSDKQYAKRKAQIEEEQTENNRKLARINQAMALATAVINISEAITKGMASSGNIFLAVGQAVAYGALGAIQIATIEAQSFANGRGLIDMLSNGRQSDTIPARIGKGEFVMPADKTAQNINELEAMRNGIKTTSSTQVVQNFYSVPLESMIQVQRDMQRKNLTTARI